jgi:hypothetical protein
VSATAGDEAGSPWRWSDDLLLAESIVAKLMDNPDLADAVYKKLDAEYSRRRYEKKRRSEEQELGRRARRAQA